MKNAMTLAMGLCLVACGDDGDGGTPADALGVGAECQSSDDCLHEGDGGFDLVCLTQFKGGYCGLKNCTGNDACPDASACVAHDDGDSYCFRSCTDKVECNANRSSDQEANCSSKIDYVDPDTKGKACVPPSGS